MYNNFHCVISLLYVFEITTSIATTSKWIFLTGNSANDSIESNVSITTGSSVTVSKSGHWNISVASQYGADLEISMNKNWGFHPNKSSTINIEIDGITPDATHDTDLIAVFSVNNEQYFACSMRLDTVQSFAYKIFPNTNQALATTNVFNMIYASIPNRWTRFSAFNQWFNSSPTYKKNAIWPLYFRITNDPIRNIVIYEWKDAQNNEFAVDTLYTSSFATDKGLNVYINGDDFGEKMVIKSINISYDVLSNEALSPSHVNDVIPTIYPSIPSTKSTESKIDPQFIKSAEIQTSIGSMQLNTQHIQYKEYIDKMYIIYIVAILLFVMCVIIVYMIYNIRKAQKYDILPSHHSHVKRKRNKRNEIEPNTAVVICLTSLNADGVAINTAVYNPWLTPIPKEVEMDDSTDSEYDSDDLDEMIDEERIAQTILSSGATIGTERSLSDSLRGRNNGEWSISLDLGAESDEYSCNTHDVHFDLEEIDILRPLS